MKPSEFLSVNHIDFIKGLLVAMVSGVCSMLGESFSKGIFTFDWTSIWHVAVAAGIAYLTLKFGSGPKSSVTQAQ